MRWEEAKAQFTLTKHHIVSTKQGNLETHVELQIILKEIKKNIREENLILFYPILCFYTDVDCFFVWTSMHCRTLNAF